MALRSYDSTYWYQGMAIKGFSRVANQELDRLRSPSIYLFSDSSDRDQAT